MRLVSYLEGQLGLWKRYQPDSLTVHDTSHERMVATRHSVDPFGVWRGVISDVDVNDCHTR
jgi:hypothetical protein